MRFRTNQLAIALSVVYHNLIMVLHRRYPRWVRHLLTLVAGVSPMYAAGVDRSADAGLPIVESSEVGREFVEGPVTAFARSADGLLFVGSNLLASFDGHSWRHIDVPGAYAFRALGASSGGWQIWVIATGEFGYLRRTASGEWKFFSLKAQLLEAGVPDAGDIRFVFPTSEGAVFVSRSKIIRLEPILLPSPDDKVVNQSDESAHIRVKMWDLPSSVKPFAFSDNDVLLIYEIGIGLMRMEAGGPRLWLPEVSLPAPPPMLAYLSLPGDSAIAVFSEAVYRLEKGIWSRFDEASALLQRKHALRAIRLDSGIVAIGTNEGGVLLMGSDGTVLNNLDASTSLIHSDIDALWDDGHGRLWIGMWSGFARLDTVRAASIFDQRSQLVTQVMRKVVLNEGRPNVITSHSVYPLESSRSIEPAHFSRINTDWTLVRDGIVRDGVIWLAVDDGLWSISDGRASHQLGQSSGIYFLATLKNLRQGFLLLENNRIRAWLKDEKGDWRVRDLGQSLESAPVSQVQDDAGNLWVSTASGAIHVFTWDPAALSLKVVGNYSFEDKNRPTGRPPILSFVHGQLFALTETEILAFDPARARFIPAKQFLGFIASATTHGDGSREYWVVRRREFGVNGPRALLRLEPGATSDHPLDVDPFVVSGLDQIGAVTNIDVTQNKDVEVLWIGGVSALLRVEVSKLPRPEGVPVATLQSVSVNGSPPILALSDGQASLAAGFRQLEFYFASGATAPVDPVFLYQSKLDDIEDEWSPAQPDTKRSFTGLPPGKYVFKARAVDRFGRIGAQMRYAFLVEAPWYRRPLAIALWFALAASLAIGAVRLRLHRLYRQTDRLNQLVKERTRELSLSNTAKSEFLESISHEIRNPLNGVVGLVQMLEESGLQGKQRDYAQSLKECSESLSRVFNEVLNFSKLEYGFVQVENRPFSLIELLNSVVAECVAASSQREIIPTIRLPSDFVDSFIGDDGKIRTIVGNFVNNAFKYAPGMPVEITVSTFEAGPDRLELLIEVSDRGPGVPPEEQGLIFKKFIRGSMAKNLAIPGTGIGLATCRILAKLLGGSVGIDSPGSPSTGNSSSETVATAGSVFFLKLPLARNCFKPPLILSDETDHATILIVEDQHFNQVIFAGILARLQRTAKLAGNAEEALAAFKRRPYSFVFIDMELPDAKGPDVANRIRMIPRGAAAVIIGMSADGSRDESNRCSKGGMNAFLLKPLTIETVKAALEMKCSFAATAQQKSSSLDFTALELYASSVPGGMPAAVQTYLRILEEEVRELLTAAKAKIPEQMVARAHRVRSHAILIGGSPLSRAAGAFETAARDGNFANVDQLAIAILQAAEEIKTLVTAKALVGSGLSA